MSELLVLQEIMGRIKYKENLDCVPLPSEYFDLIGGTSTGGLVINDRPFDSANLFLLCDRLIALMLGRLRMPVSDAIEFYSHLAKRVFSDGRQRFGDGKFDARVLTEVIKEIVEKKTSNADSRMMDTRSDGRVCKTYVRVLT